MLKTINRLFFILVAAFILVLSLSRANLVLAASEQNGVLEITYPGNSSLFTIDNAYPGMNAPRTVTITNHGQLSHSLSIATKGQLGKLAPVTYIKILRHSDQSLIWQKKLSQINPYPKFTTVIPSIKAGQIRKIDVIAILPEWLGNEYQGKTTLVFDFIAGNEVETTPDDNEDNNSNDDGADSGSTITESTSQDSDSPQTTAITANTTATQRQTSNQPQDTVRDESKLNDQKTLKSFDLPATDEGQIKGAAASTCVSNIWWWILLVILAVFLLIYGIIIRKEEKFFWRYIPPILAGVAIYIVFLLIDRSCCSSFWWCKFFWLIDLAEVVLYIVLMRFVFKPEEQQQKHQNENKQIIDDKDW